MKKLLFILYQKLIGVFWGTGLGRIPPINWVYRFTLQLLSPLEGIMEVGGNKMYCGVDKLPASYSVAFEAYKRGWESETTQIFKKLTQEGDVVVDIGANMGYYTLLSAKIVGDSGKVYAFEPNPMNMYLLKRNIRLNGFKNVVVEPKAVSDKNGEVELYLNDSDVGGHTIYKPNKVKKSVVVDSVTLDEYFKGREHLIDIVKMDIEGAEFSALSGMRKIISENKDLKIFVEFNLSLIKSSGLSPEYFISQLLDCYKFSITAIKDFSKCVENVKINNVAELMGICKSTNLVNLLLEKRS